MKLRLVYILLVLLLGITALPGNAGLRGHVNVPGRFLDQRESTASFAAATLRPGARGSLPPQHNSDNTCLQVAPDAVMHGSICVADDAFLIAIGVAHDHSSDAGSPANSRRGQNALFRILFRQIISPNAP